MKQAKSQNKDKPETKRNCPQLDAMHVQVGFKGKSRNFTKYWMNWCVGIMGESVFWIQQSTFLVSCVSFGWVLDEFWMNWGWVSKLREIGDRAIKPKSCGTFLEKKFCILRTRNVGEVQMQIETAARWMERQAAWLKHEQQFDVSNDFVLSHQHQPQHSIL